MVLRQEQLSALTVVRVMERVHVFLIMVGKCPEIVPVCVPFFLGEFRQIPAQITQIFVRQIAAVISAAQIRPNQIVHDRQIGRVLPTIP